MIADPDPISDDPADPFHPVAVGNSDLGSDAPESHSPEDDAAVLEESTGHDPALAALDVGWALDAPPLTAERIFGDDHPWELEIGCGRGRFLCNAAGARPGVNFLGIERSRKFFLITAAAVAARSLPNVRLLCVDASAVVRNFLPEGSLSAVHIYYPDPWPKRRHERRRMIQPEMPAILRRVIRTGGFLYFQTDVRSYFERVLALFGSQPGWRVAAAAEIPGETRDADLAGTHWQTKAFRQGFAAHRLVAEAVAFPS